MSGPSISGLPDYPPLRKLVRSKLTNHFLTSDYGWTSHIRLALDIPDVAERLALCLRLKLQDVEAYYSFDLHRRSKFDFTLPIRRL